MSDQKLIMTKQKRWLLTEINHLQKLGVSEPACHSSGEFISTIFVRQKKSGKYRMILNLKGLNRHIEYHHFKMDTLWSAVRLMTPQCHMASLDLKDAYYSVPIADEHRKYLSFYWKGQLFQYTCLPNGLSSAPRYFTKIVTPVYSTLRKRGHLNVGYIDDSYLQGSNESECALNVADTRALFTDVGFVISEEKSVTTPIQLIVFLGFILDSRLMHITLTLEKKEKLKDMCSTLLSEPVITINELSQIIGKLVSSFPGVEFGKLYYRQLEIEKNIALKANMGNYDASLSLTSRAQSELRWWVENVDHSFNPVSHGYPQVTLTTDASKLGWGAHVDSNATQGRWAIEESQLHINELELKAIEFAVRAFSSCLEGKHVKVESDNSTAVTYINSMGGTKSPRCNDIAYQIWSWCIIKNIWLTATHIAGVTNTRDDEESRLFNDRTEWTLDKTIFAKIVEHWGLPDVDLFAARINTQLPKFVSWQPDPEAIFVDAFSID